MTPTASVSLPDFDRARLEATQDLIDTVYRFETPKRLPFHFFVLPHDWDPDTHRLVDAHAVELQLGRWSDWQQMLDEAVAGMHAGASQTYSPQLFRPMIALGCPQETFLTPLGLPWKKLSDGRVELDFSKPLITDIERDLPRLEAKLDTYLQSGMMPELFARAEFFLQQTGYQIPLTFPDYQGPLSLATKLMDTTQLMIQAMLDPAPVKRLLDFMAEIINLGLAELERICGRPELLQPHYNLPRGSRAHVWDDYVSVLSPELYSAVALDANAKLLQARGRGHLHTCGPCLGFVEAIISNPDVLSFDVIFADGARMRTTEHVRALKQQARGRAVLNVCGMVEDHENFTPEFVREMMDGGGVQFFCAGGSERQMTKWLRAIDEAATD